MRWRATVCYAGIRSRTEGQGALDKGTRDPSLAMCWTSIARAYPSVRQDSPVCTLFERYNLVSARLS